MAITKCNINTLQNVIISVYITGREKELRSMLKEETLKKAQDGDLKSIEDICSLTWRLCTALCIIKFKTARKLRI